jgi:hypothetical protein
MLPQYMKIQAVGSRPAHGTSSRQNIFWIKIEVFLTREVKKMKKSIKVISKGVVKNNIDALCCAAPMIRLSSF